MIIEDNEDLNNTLKEFLQQKEIFDIVGTACDGNRGLELIKTRKADAVLLDIVMPGKDGLAILEEFQELPKDKKPAFIMFTAVSAEVFTQRAMELGADYFILKPFDLEILSRRIIQVCAKKQAAVSDGSNSSLVELVKETEIEEFISSVLNQAGIATNLKGYKYLKTALTLAAQEENLLYNMTKKLYPRVAEICNVRNAAQVERSMRHAIGLSWQRNKEQILSIMPAGSSSMMNKPTNSIFLFSVIDLYKRSSGTY